jgi:alpha-tubulin suppressor-like RCC1 family protein
MKSEYIKTAMDICVVILLVHILSACSQCSQEPAGPVKAQPLVVTIDSPDAPLTLYENESVDFAATASGGTHPYVYEWDFSGGAEKADMENSGSVVFSTPGSYKVSLSVTDVTGEQAVDLIMIEVLADTVPSVSIDSPAKDITIKEGDSVDFAASVSDGNEPLVYEWDFSIPGVKSLKEDPGRITFPDAGFYTVRFIAGDDNEDTDSASVVVNVEKNLPKAAISSPEGNAVILEGQSVFFKADVAGGNGPFSYAWDFGNGKKSTKKDPGKVIFPDAGTYPIEFHAYDYNKDADSDTIVVEVKKNIPKISIDSPADNTVIYEGESVICKGSIAGGNRPFSCEWDFSGGAQNSQIQDPGRVIFNKPSTYQVTLTVEDRHKDSDSKLVNLRVLPDTKPAAKILSPRTDITILEDRPVLFEGIVEGGNTPVSYKWDFGGAVSASSALSPGNVTFKNPGTYQVVFSVTDDNSDVSKDVRIITVIKDTTPVVSILTPADDTLITERGSLVFSASVIEGNEPLTYKWDFAGAAQNVSVLNPGELLLENIGTFEIVLTITDSDGDIASDSVTVNIVRDTRPRATIVSPRHHLRIYEGEGVNFAGSVIDGNLPLKYIWDFEGGAKKLKIEDPGEVLFNKPGTYTVNFIVEDRDGDIGKDTVSVTVIKSTWSFVAGGWSHSIGLKTDGSLWAWGWNLQGQLGNGLNASSNKPTHIGQERTWKEVFIGSAHSLALKSDRTLWGWGSNTSGQLGVGARKQVFAPVKIGGNNTWSHMAAGSYHTLAVKADGSLWVWGRNIEGQLGDGTYSYSTTPVRIGSDNDWGQVAAGEAHSIALKKDGTLWCWGSNELGQLGDGTKLSSEKPKQVGAGFKWISIAAGKRHSMAIRKDGSLWAWGANIWGQLGDGTKVFKSFPVRVGRDNNWKHISAGEYHSAGLKKDGSIWCWGWNAFGQLGTDSFKDIYVPTRVGIATDWTWIAAGLHHTLAVKKNGTLWTWGYNGYGQLGDSTNEDKCTPMLLR